MAPRDQEAQPAQHLLVVLISVLMSFFADDRYFLLRYRDYRLNRPSSSPLSRREMARTQEVAELLLEIYHTLAEMRYLDPLCISSGPHDLSHVQETIDSYNLDPAIVHLYRIMPYVEGEQTAFFQGSQFADFRRTNDVEEARDPFYGNPRYEARFNEEDGPYMRPWVTPLSLIGNHQSVIIYDVRQHRIWIIDQESWCSSDPALEGKDHMPALSLNNNAFEHIPSRPAADVLKDINKWYRQLTILPGGGDDTGSEWDHYDMDLPSIYRNHGWPDRFDGEAFEVEQARKSRAVWAKYVAEEPLRRLATLQSWVEGFPQEIQRAKEAVLKATSEEEKETAKLAQWKSEYAQKRRIKELAPAQEMADKFCPGGVCQREEDLPLWEFETVKSEYESVQNRLRDLQEEGATSDKDHEFRKAQRDVAIYQKAFDLSKAACEKLSSDIMESHLALVWPKGPDPNRLRDDINRMQQYVDDFKEYLAAVPESAPKTRKAIELDIEHAEKLIESRKIGL
ncbi:unnamed protein product [Clonostachys rosea]|uniref:Ubiquitin-like protease family profile domain-containing protein n=1 Tax=Bionectria ochroleuca TaxID=29856 RepID=A0ABY6UDR0_BIOOC|nr:unnamed protein product [Clonostachys rosea]